MFKINLLFFRPTLPSSSEDNSGLVDLQAGANTTYDISGSLAGQLHFENFDTSVAIEFNGSNINAFEASLVYEGENLEVTAQLSFSQGNFLIILDLECPIRSFGSASMKLINITEVPLTANGNITYCGDCNNDGLRYSLQVN